MQTITTIGLDIAKSVFQVHGGRQKNDMADGSDLRGGHPSQHAFRTDKHPRTAELPDAHRTRHVFIRQQTAVSHRTCQQDCADGLGHDGQGRALQRTHRACAVNEIAPGNRCDVKLGGRTTRNAEPVDPAIRTTHLCHRIAIECVFLTGT